MVINFCAVSRVGQWRSKAMPRTDLEVGSDPMRARRGCVLCSASGAFCSGMSLNDRHHPKINKVSRNMKKLATCLLLICSGSALAQQSIPGRTNSLVISTEVISQSGSYKLQGNIEAPQTGSNGVNSANAIIRVDASNVVLDLGGHTIGTRNLNCVTDAQPFTSCSAIPGRFVVNYGVLVSPGVRNVTIRNGTIVGVFADGIRCEEGCTIENITVDAALGNGIKVGSPAQIRNFKVMRADTGVSMFAGQISDIALSDVRWGVSSLFRVVASDISVTRFQRTAVSLGLSSSLTGCSISGGSRVSESIGLQLQEGTAANCAIGGASVGVRMSDGSMLRDSTVNWSVGLGIEAGVSTGYSGVVLFNNNNGGAQVVGGTSLGGNLCNGVAC